MKTQLSNPGNVPAFDSSLVPLIASDFRDENGVRLTCFNLCVRHDGNLRMAAHAIVNFEDGKVTRFIATEPFKPRHDAIVRMARKYLHRSTPVVFHRTALPA